MDIDAIFSDVDSLIVDTFPTQFVLDLGGGQSANLTGSLSDKYEDFDVERGTKVLINAVNLRVAMNKMPANKMKTGALIEIKGIEYTVREVKPGAFQMARIVLEEV